MPSRVDILQQCGKERDMSDREDMVALADFLDCMARSMMGDGSSPALDEMFRPRAAKLKQAAAALRSAARTGPDVADNGILNAAKFVASRDREMLAQMLFALHERHDSPSPIRFNCSWKQLKSFNRASFYKCADDIRALAAIPAPATASVGEEVTADELITVMMKCNQLWRLEARKISRGLLSTYKITKRSAT